MSPSRRKKIAAGLRRAWRRARREIAAGKRISYVNKRKPRRAA